MVTSPVARMVSLLSKLTAQSADSKQLEGVARDATRRQQRYRKSNTEIGLLARALSAFIQIFDQLKRTSADAQRTSELLGTILQWRDMTAEQQLTENVSAVVSAARTGNLGQRVRVGTDGGFFGALGTEVNGLVDSITDTFAQVRELHDALAAGQLQSCIDVYEWIGNFAALRENANQSIAQLSPLVSSLRNTVHLVSTQSGQIRDANNQASQRIERQVASLDALASPPTSRNAPPPRATGRAHCRRPSESWACCAKPGAADCRSAVPGNITKLSPGAVSTSARST